MTTGFKMKKGNISLKNVSKVYKLRGMGFGKKNKKSFLAIDDVNIEIKSGDRYGIIGHNGSGKTTLLKLVAGISRVSKGEVTVCGKVNSLLEIGAGFHPDLSGAENIMLNGLLAGMSRNEVRNKMDKIIEFSGISEFIRMPFYTYSSGMKLKLAFSVAVHANPDILIFDEVVSMGDEKFIQMFKEYFKSILEKNVTIIFATHILDVLSLYCDKTIWMERGKIKMVGKTDDVIRKYKKAYSTD